MFPQFPKIELSEIPYSCSVFFVIKYAQHFCFIINVIKKEEEKYRKYQKYLSPPKQNSKIASVFTKSFNLKNVCFTIYLFYVC